MSRVSLMLEYFHPWPNAAGFYLARERGWYQEADIELEIRLFDRARGDTLEYLLQGEVDFGVFPSNRLMVRRERGEALRGIASVNHGGLETIQTVRRTGITRPRELAGRRIAMGTTPRGIAMVKHLIEADGGDSSAAVLIDNQGREFTVDHIEAGEFDATFGGYWAWDALFGALPEAERVTWRVDDIGAPPYHSYLLGAHDSLLDANPKLVGRFLAATARGYAQAVADPAAALTAIERAIPYFPRSLLERSIELISTTWTHRGRWGEQRPKLLAGYATWLEAHGILRNADTWRHAVTNEFLPETEVAA
ncbi:MAG: ABC transporter substrate-binding protein [Steroidobacteraceae bacterium]|jgi:NitT/TauT family transport system substrate-binding protein